MARGEAGQTFAPTAPEDTAAPRKRGLTNRRISNQKLKLDLGYASKFPDYCSGYTAEIDSLRGLLS